MSFFIFPETRHGCQKAPKSKIKTKRGGKLTLLDGGGAGSFIIGVVGHVAITGSVDPVLTPLS